MALTVVQPGVGGTGNANLTFPNVTGTVMVSGNMPAFSATNNAVQSFSSSTFTKVSFQTEVFDTNSNFASSRFTPTVAGYYQINASLYHNWATPGSVASTIIYKNGSANTATSSRFGSAVGPWGAITTTTVLYLNGSTDYVEVYAWTNNGSPSIDPSNLDNITTFSGCLVRSA